MVSSMKTTVHISDGLLEQAKRLASKRSLTLRELVEEGLRRVLREAREPDTFALRDARVGGQGLQPELRDSSWDRIRDMVYEDRGA